jgi:hypothetical protein
VVIVDIPHSGDVEQVEPGRGRRIEEPGLGERQLLIAARRAVLELEADLLAVPEQVVVPELDESGEPPSDE